MQNSEGRPTTIPAENVLTRLDLKHSKHWPEKLPLSSGKFKRMAQQVCVVCKPMPLGRWFQKGEQIPMPENNMYVRRMQGFIVRKHVF